MLDMSKLDHAETYIVGGFVRDRLLGREAHDHDFVVVGATAQDMIDAGFEPIEASAFPVFHHPITHDEFALARTEKKTGNGYHGFEVWADPTITIEEDLARRDITINAMARRVLGWNDQGHAKLSDVVVDPFKGRMDLANEVIRHTSEAFKDDPVRVLRVARFAARYRFNIAPETIKLMKGMVKSNELDHLTAERVFLELEKVFHEDQPGMFFEILDAIGAIKVVMPELIGFANDASCCSNKTIHVNERFAVFALGLGEEKIELLFDRLKAPTHYKRIAMKTERFRRWDARVHRKDPIPVEDYVTLFTKMDLLRSPEEFDLCIQAFRQVHPVRNIQDLKNAKEAFMSVTFDQLPESPVPLVGKQIGEAMNRERFERIEKALQLNLYP